MLMTSILRLKPALTGSLWRGPGRASGFLGDDIIIFIKVDDW
jgi:hypothetical protein